MSDTTECRPPQLRMVGGRRMQCKDIPDEVFLDAVRRSGEPGRWRMRWDVQAELETVLGPLPENLFLAKVRKLIAAGKMGGCGCGCRGDYELPGETPGSAPPRPPAISVTEWLAKLSKDMAGVMSMRTAWDAPSRAALDRQAREQNYLNQALAIGASEEAARDMLEAVIGEREEIRRWQELGWWAPGLESVLGHGPDDDVFVLARGRLAAMTFQTEPALTADRTMGTAYARWKATNG